MKASGATIVRTIILSIALLNQILSAAGRPVLPIEDGTVEALVTSGVTVVTAVVAWWKNNSFTDAAIEGDKVMNHAKAVKK
ncbi:phage holin [Candidatus Avoscillospira sp. LCP25S3_F1]|uniref:phage holin n=1 Tax=Candidatus Avoscillospira sp. LCP25S3_F1 TaxID=3438825 RepID=UPI003F930720